MRVIEALNILNVTSPELAVIKQAFENYVTQPFARSSRADLCKLGMEACRALEERLDYVKDHWDDLMEEMSTYTNAGRRRNTGSTEVAEGSGHSGQRNDSALNLIALYSERYEAVSKIDGVNMELCGTWLWCSGDTRPHAAELKRWGFRFAGKKKMWSWHPPTYRRRRRDEEWDMGRIRTEFGSRTVVSSRRRDDDED